MKDKTSQENWAIKNEMQMVQDPNNEATVKAKRTLSGNKNKNNGSEANRNEQPEESTLEWNTTARTPNTHTCAIVPSN